MVDKSLNDLHLGYCMGPMADDAIIIHLPGYARARGLIGGKSSQGGSKSSRAASDIEDRKIKVSRL